jgi:hypothetical protein
MSGKDMLVDIEIDFSTRNGNARVFINSRYLKVKRQGVYKQSLS